MVWLACWELASRKRTPSRIKRKRSLNANCVKVFRKHGTREAMKLKHAVTVRIVCTVRVQFGTPAFDLTFDIIANTRHAMELSSSTSPQRPIAAAAPEGSRSEGQIPDVASNLQTEADVLRSCAQLIANFRLYAQLVPISRWPGRCNESMWIHGCWCQAWIYVPDKRETIFPPASTPRDAVRPEMRFSESNDDNNGASKFPGLTNRWLATDQPLILIPDPFSYWFNMCVPPQRRPARLFSAVWRSKGEVGVRWAHRNPASWMSVRRDVQDSCLRQLGRKDGSLCGRRANQGPALSMFGFRIRQVVKNR